MNTPFTALSEMIRLTSPFPESVTVKAWKADARKIIGLAYLAVPEEVIHAAGMLPFRLSGDNQPLPMQLAESYVLFNQCGVTKGLWQQVLEGKYAFLNGVVLSNFCDGIRRLYDNWVEFKPMPFIDVINFPRKASEDAVQMYLADLEEWRDRLSEFRMQRIQDIELQRSIAVYNRTRELMQAFYEVRKRDRPPVTGAETMEMMKAAGRMPREQYNDLLAQLLDEVKGSGREIKKGKRLMIVGNDIHNSHWIAAIEELDAVVVTDEMNAGSRYFAGKVDTGLPPMEAIARHYVLGRPQEAMTFESNRFDYIVKLAKDYKVDGVVSENLRYCAPVGNDKPWLKKEMVKHGIPIMELDLEYCEEPSGQTTLRAEAFLELLQS
ncbi:MAG TPA: 2-hydroxyacyl-CoA dehydratase family protein [Anaerolineales bacterium]|nr:2-hydroxyacyl-CoA dehydratase family protein [Anaerolineales bacterium]